jgi:ABC-type sulfate transport system permease subunit
VAIVSGAIVDKTETMTLFINDSFDNLDPTGAYAGAVILALISLGVLLVLGGDRGRRREQRWQSASVESPSDTERPLLLTT